MKKSLFVNNFCEFVNHDEIIICCVYADLKSSMLLQQFH